MDIFKDRLHVNRINVLVANLRDHSLNRDLLNFYLESFKRFLDELADVEVNLNYALTSPLASLIHVEAASWWADFKFSKPTTVTLVGGVSLGYFCKNDTVDVALELPADIFNQKDYLNYRCINKRNAYMYHLYRQLCNGDQLVLQTTDGAYTPKISLSTDGSKQNIILQYYKDNKLALKLRLVACLPIDKFKIACLAADRNCIRIPAGDRNRKDETGEINPTPTPRYNSCVIEDLLMLPLQAELKGLVSLYEHLDSAVILFKKWCSIRSCLDSKDYNTGISGVVGFLIGAHVCSCMQLPPSVDGFTIFKAMLRFISTFTCGSRAIFKDSNIIRDEGFQLPHFVLFEHFNILYKTLLIWDEMVDHATASIATLKSDCPYIYTRLFEIEYIPQCCFDSCLVFDNHVHSPFRVLPIVPKLWAFSNNWWFGYTFEEYLAFQVRNVLKYGLADAIDRCCFRKAYYTPHVGRRLFVFVGYNEAVFNSVRLGPQSNDKAEVAKFREFWGSIAETRRFPDGSILEVAEIVHNFSNTTRVELVDTNSSCHSLYSSLVNKLTTRFFGQMYEIKVSNTLGQSGSDKTERQPSPNPDLSSGKCMIMHPPFLLQHHSTDAYTRGLIDAYNILNRLIRGLERIPLTILNVHWADEAFSYSRGQISPHALHPIILVFESSTSWPNDPVGIQHVKAAFCNSISKELLANKSDSGPLVIKVSSLGNMTVQLHGFSFLLYLTFPREVRRIEKMAQSLSSITGSTQDVDPRTLDTIYQIYVAPKYTDRLRNVALKNPSYSNAVNLAKRWVTSELIPNADFVCEMICAAVYTNDHLMCGIPTSASVGFCKFLFILAHYDWKHRPFVVEFDEPWSDFPLELLDKKELALKVSLPLPYIWIATRQDLYCRLVKMPCDALCVRLTLAARDMLNRMRMHEPWTLGDREQRDKLSHYHMHISFDDLFNGNLNQQETRQVQYANKMLINGIDTLTREIGYIAYNAYYFNGAISSLGSRQQNAWDNLNCCYQNPGLFLKFDSRALVPSRNANMLSKTPKTLVDAQRHINSLPKRKNRLVACAIHNSEALILVNLPMLLYDICSIAGTSINCQFLINEST